MNIGLNHPDAATKKLRTRMTFSLQISSSFTRQHVFILELGAPLARLCTPWGCAVLTAAHSLAQDSARAGVHQRESGFGNEVGEGTETPRASWRSGGYSYVSLIKSHR